MNSKPAIITPSVGRAVHFVLPNGEHRPATIVRIFDPEPTPRSVVNLQVLLDGLNDARAVDNSIAGYLWWRTSVHQDAEKLTPGTWHFPEPIAQPAS